MLLESDIFFKYDGIWEKGRSITIGNEVFIGKGCEFNINCKIVIHDYVNIASGCKFIDHDHGISASERIGPQKSVRAEIIIDEDAWLGVNVIVLKGVSIGIWMQTTGSGRRGNKVGACLRNMGR